MHKLDDKRNRFKKKSIEKKNFFFQLNINLMRNYKIGGPDCLLKTQFSAMIKIIVLGMKLAQCQ
jgi:hypothetical protein